MTAARLQELAQAFAKDIDVGLDVRGERCVAILVLCGTQPGDPLAVASNVAEKFRPGLVANLRAAAAAIEGE